ncbi:MAG TPA: hypothetical protein VHJ20_02370 [Polyangia bacterium]|nr:hypothetical protein [Polyangia bacterium]
MNAPQARRYARQLALPEVGPEGQDLLARARVAIVGPEGSVAAETAARYLAAAGVGTLRLIGTKSSSGVDGDLRGSNPDVVIEREARPSEGRAWLAALEGVDLVVRVGFDDDALLRAAVRRGVPVVVARVEGGAADVVSFRRHGPCPHAPLDVPVQAASTDAAGAGDVVAGTLAASEALTALLHLGGDARARHLRVPLDGRDATAQEIPWTPECFACGGSGHEMSFT